MLGRFATVRVATTDVRRVAATRAGCVGCTDHINCRARVIRFDGMVLTPLLDPVVPTTRITTRALMAFLRHACCWFGRGTESSVTSQNDARRDRAPSLPTSVATSSWCGRRRLCVVHNRFGSHGVFSCGILLVYLATTSHTAVRHLSRLDGNGAHCTGKVFKSLREPSRQAMQQFPPDGAER